MILRQDGVIDCSPFQMVYQCYFINKTVIFMQNYERKPACGEEKEGEFF